MLDNALSFSEIWMAGSVEAHQNHVRSWAESGAGDAPVTSM